MAALSEFEWQGSQVQANMMTQINCTPLRLFIVDMSKEWTGDIHNKRLDLEIAEDMDQR